MKSFIICTGLVMCLCLNSNAQFQRMKKGDASIYDNSVNVELSEYRSIRRHLLTGDTLVTNLRQEIQDQKGIILEQQKTISKRDTLIASQTATILRKDSVTAALNKNFQDAIKIVEDEPETIFGKIFKSPWTYFTIGVLSGIGIKSL